MKYLKDYWLDTVILIFLLSILCCVKGRDIGEESNNNETIKEEAEEFSSDDSIDSESD